MPPSDPAVAGTKSTTVIASVSTTLVCSEVVDLVTGNSDVFQHSIVECRQGRSRLPALVLVAHARPKIGKARGDPCAPTGEIGSRDLESREAVRLDRTIHDRLPRRATRAVPGAWPRRRRQSRQ